MPGDLNEDLRVDFADAAILGWHWGRTDCAAPAFCGRADFEPDLICLFVNSVQAMRLSQAAANGGGGIAPTLPSGMGSCGDIAARTVKTDLSQFILPSGGTRVYASTQDDELIFTIPKSKIDLMMKALQDTHAIGFRYPVLTDVRHRPNLPPFLEIPKNA